VTRVSAISVPNSLVSRKFLETIKCIDAKVYNLEYHQKRLEGVLNTFAIVQKYNLKELLSPPKKGLYRCRFVYSEHGCEIEYVAYQKRTIRSLKIVYSDEIEYSHKYLDRGLIETLFELRGSCDDILIVKSGLIRDTSIANVAFFDGANWYTPKRPLLEGTARQRYIESGLIKEKDIFVEDLREFRGVALMNAMVDFDIISIDNIGEVIC